MTCVSYEKPTEFAHGARELTAPRAVGIGFGLLMACLAFMAIGKSVFYDTLDPDLFWHLCVADRVAASGWPQPLVDDLSFSSLRHPWTPYSWLGELGMKFTWDRGGYRAALAIQSAMEAGIILFIGLAALEASAAAHQQPRRLTAALAAFVGAFLALPYLSFRPVTFTFLLLAMSSWLLTRDRRMGESSKTVWLLVPATILLTNVHLFAAMVPASVSALALGAWWERRRNPSEDATRRFRRYTRLTAATAGACLLTPMLPGVIATAAHYQFEDVMVGSPYIQEMLPFYRANPLAPVAAVMAVGVLFFAIRQRTLLRVGEWLWIIGTAMATVRLGRFVPAFAIFAVPALGATLPRLSDRILGKPVAISAIFILALAYGVRIERAFPSADMPMSQWINRLSPESAYPTSAADFVSAHISPRSGRILNEFTWGGFLEWRLGGTYQTFLDGRTQLFSAAFWKSTYLATPQQRTAYLSTVAADAAVLPKRKSILRESLGQLGWQVVYSDPTAEVLVPPSSVTLREHEGSQSPALTPG
jgi:hypothetical protein